MTAFDRTAGGPVRLRNSAARWGALAKAFHWLTALLVLAAGALGWAVNLNEDSRTLLMLHVSAGALILILALAGFAWRLADPAPSAPRGSPPLQARAAWITHRTISASVLVMLASGYVLVVHTIARDPGQALLFGLAPLPMAFQPGEDEALRAAAWRVHYYGFFWLVLLLALHVGAALWRRFVRKDDVLRRML